jgi:hypothetical protein
MTYAVGGLIESSDYNNLINIANPNVNQIWSLGSGNSGYGQPALQSVANGELVYADTWLALIRAIQNSASHQGTTLTNFNNPSPLPGELISWEAVMNNNIAAIYNNRANSSLFGPTTVTTATNSVISWTNSLTITFTCTWPSHNQARYYFNAGGQIGLNFSHPDTSSLINISFRRICSTLGTIWLSSPSSGTVLLQGVNYSGVTQIGGILSDSTISSNLGFYGLTTSNQQLVQHVDDFTGYYYYTNSFLTIFGRYDGAGVLTLTTVLTEVPAGSAVVAPGTAGFLTVRPPALVFISNSWNGPIVSSSITGS